MIMFMEKLLDDIIMTHWVQVFAVEEALIPDAMCCSRRAIDFLKSTFCCVIRDLVN